MKGASAMKNNFGFEVVRGSDLPIKNWPSAAVKSWGWVSVPELASAIKVDSLELIATFGALSKDLYGYAPCVHKQGRQQGQDEEHKEQGRR